MSGSFRIARVAGIEVKIHFTFILLLVWLAFGDYQQGGGNYAVARVTFTLLLFLCVLLHEFGHAFAARRFGIKTPDITLLPIGGVARLERIPSNPWQELFIAVAGPLVNVAIVVVLLPFIPWGRVLGGHWPVFENSAGELIFSLIRVNMMLILFNLLPAFPMDGGRVLRALLAMKWNHMLATQIAARVGQGVAVLFAVAGIYGIPGFAQFLREIQSPGLRMAVEFLGISGFAYPNPFLLFIAMFVFMGAQQELAYAEFLGRAGKTHVKDVMITAFTTLPAEMPLREALEITSHRPQPAYPVIGTGMQGIGLVTPAEISSLAAANDPARHLSEFVSPGPVLQADTLIPDAIQSLPAESVAGAHPVVNPSGQIIGIVQFGR